MGELEVAFFEWIENCETKDCGIDRVKRGFATLVEQSQNGLFVIA